MSRKKRTAVLVSVGSAIVNRVVRECEQRPWEGEDKALGNEHLRNETGVCLGAEATVAASEGGREVGGIRSGPSGRRLEPRFTPCLAWARSPQTCCTSWASVWILSKGVMWSDWSFRRSSHAAVLRTNYRRKGGSRETSEASIVTEERAWWLGQRAMVGGVINTWFWNYFAGRTNVHVWENELFQASYLS